MSKVLSINCGNALLLQDRINGFDGYEAIRMNCGNIIIESELYSKLMARNTSLNAGNITIVNINGKIIELGANPRIRENVDYTGCFLVADGDLILDADSIHALKDADALCVTGSIYYPASMPLSSMNTIYYGTPTPYPDGAKVLLGDITLNANAVLSFPDNGSVYISGRLSLLENEIVETVLQRNIRFQCAELFTTESIFTKTRTLCTADAIILVPDNHYIVEDITLEAQSALIYGDQIYVKGDLLLRPDDSCCLDDFRSIIVKGHARIPISCVKAFKEIGKADDICAYEGILLRISGKGNLTHAQLEAAKQGNISYTLEVNGMLEIGNDVSADDLSCIHALYYNGQIIVRDEIKLYVERLVREGNGIISAPKSDYKEPNKPDDNTTYINMGNFRL